MVGREQEFALLVEMLDRLDLPQGDRDPRPRLSG
jgi:hypothetical protein